MRYCECGRELDRYQHLCSECGYYHRQITMTYSQGKLKESMNKRQLEYYHRTKITRGEWRKIACQSSTT